GGVVRAEAGYRTDAVTHGCPAFARDDRVQASSRPEQPHSGCAVEGSACCTPCNSRSLDLGGSLGMTECRRHPDRSNREAVAQWRDLLVARVLRHINAESC